MRKVWSLLYKDLLTVYRNGFMAVLALTSLVQAAVLRALVPLGITHLPWMPPDTHLLVAPLVALLPAFMVGMAAGYGLVTERETRAATSLRVMPLDARVFLAYLIGWQAAFAGVLSPITLLIYGTQPASWIDAAVVIVAASLTAGLLSLVLGSLASNRIEALAVSKLLGVLLFIPAFALVLPPGLQLLVAWNPWYWAFMGLLGALAGPDAGGLSLLRYPGYPPLVSAAACLLLALGWTRLLYRIYQGRLD